ncbi:calphotin-like [Embiotoca jacksoni]|uniref:calphotin-like n=1 Tax=Embiotoca jacksoni TaxID=100190 RepID=UPI003703F3DE
MDVQTDNMDPPPGESQPSGKIRKGFKLFGKRKPGNIFSIRSKGDGNNKSPVNKSKNLDGLSETPAPDSELEQDKEKNQEVSQGDEEQAEEEPLSEDGILAAAPPRASISSVSSAKSLGFLSLLRGGRRGVGDRQVHTVSQPVTRQRRGLKGLFGNVKFRSKDKEDKEEAPPSPLLMSSRANSVEIIKEDLTLTPKSQPRSLNSPVSDSCEPLTSITTQDSAATTPSETMSPQLTAGSVRRANEHVPPWPTSEPPLVPGDKSLSTLLADISSLLTFDSISGGGDVMADVEAEWGKASSAISTAVTEVSPSSTFLFFKPTISSPLTTTTVGTAATAKPSPVTITTIASPQSFTPLTKTTPTFSPISRPSTIITTLTKSSTLTTHAVKLSSDSTPASEPSTSVKMKSTPVPTATKPSTTPVTVTNLSAPVSSPSVTIKSTPSSTAATTTAPPNTPATVVKAPSISPTLTSTASKLASEIAPPQMIASVSKPSPVATSPRVSAKPPPVTHSPPIHISITQPPPAKLDSASSLNFQTFYKPSLSSGAGESKAPVTVLPACTVTTKPPSPAPVIQSKMKTAPTSTAYVALSKPSVTSAPVDLKKTPPLLVTVPDFSPSTTTLVTTKAQPSPASVPTPFSTSLDKIPPTTKPTSAPISLDKMPPAPATIPAPATHAVASPTPPAPGQITVSVFKDLPAPVLTQVSQSKAPPTPAQVPVSIFKDPPVPAQMQITQPKVPPFPAQIPVSVSKAPPAPVEIPVSVSKAPPAPVEIPVSVSEAPPAPVEIPVSVSKAPPAPVEIPVSVSKAPPAPVEIPVSVPKTAPAPVEIPVSVPKTAPAPVEIPVSVPKTAPAPVEIPVSVPKTAPAPVEIQVSVPKTAPAPVSFTVSVSKTSPGPAQIPVSVSTNPPAPVSFTVSVSKDFSASAQIPVSQSKAHPAPVTAPCPVTSPLSPPAPWPSEAPASAKTRGSGLVSVDQQLAGPNSTGAQRVHTVASKTEEFHDESQTSLRGLSREKKTPQVKASGLSKIPVVGGGRVGKLPVRDSQHVDDEPSRDPPTPVLQEERPHFNSHDAGRKDKISAVEANAPTSKHTQEESQQLQQPKVLTSSARDSKIPVKHGAQAHTASQIPQSKEATRTKIPVSKVPVRRAGNKPGATGGSMQMRK